MNDATQSVVSRGTKIRVYLVTSLLAGDQLVKAKSASAAVKHVAVARLAKQDDLISALSAGGKIEEAK